MAEESEVRIGITADDSGLVQAFEHARQTVESGASGISEQLDGIKESMLHVTEALGIGFAVDKIKEASKELGEMAHEALEAAEQITHLQQTLGVSIETIQTVSYAAQLAGGNLDTATNALTRLTRSAAEANSGNEKLLGYFNAIGISSEQLAQLIKNPDDMIRVVTQHLAEFGDGANKTAIEMGLMGRGAGAMVPLINELGENWKGLNEEALKFAGVTADDVLAMADAQQAINKTNAEFAGLKAELAVNLLPAINNVNQGFREFAEDRTTHDAIKGIGDMATYATEHWKQLLTAVATGSLGAFIIKDFAESTQAGLNFSNTIGIGFAKIRELGEEAWATIEFAAQTAFVNMEHGLASLAGGAALVAFATGNKQLADQLADLSVHMQKATADTTGYKAAMEKADATFTDYVANLKVTAGAQQQNTTTMETMTVTAGHLGDKLLELPTKVTQNAAALSEELGKWQEQLDMLAAKSAGPYDAANLQYLATMQRLNDELVKMIGNGLSVADALKMDADATDAATAAYWKMIAADQQKHDLADDWIQKLKDQVTQTGLLTDAQKASAEFEALATKNLLENRDALGEWHETAQQAIDANANIKQGYVDDATALMQYTDQLKLSAEQQRQWQQIASSAFDSAFSTINKDIIEGGNVMKDLTNVAKQVVESIIMQFEKLAIINPILNSIFGLSGTSGAMPTASFGSIFGNIAGMFGGGGAGGGGLMSLATGNAGGGGLVSEAMNTNQLAGTANNAWNWLMGGGAAFDSTSGMYLMSSSDALGLVPDYAGAGVDFAGQGALQGTYGDVGGAGAASGGMGLGQILGIGGGILAGINEFNNAGGGLAGIAGGVAYGLGTVTAAGAISGAMAGIAGGVGAAGAGAVAGGSAAAAGVGVIPVIGWVALAAMVVDMISGGKLFGTSGKPIGGAETETIDASGANVSAEMTYKGQHALFGGSYYHDKNIPVDAATQQAANDFFTALVQGTADFAKQFGQTAGDLVGGSFVQHFDKKGKPTTTEDTVLGVTYKDETQQQFAERLQADNFLAVLDHMGIGASAFVSGMQNDADKLFAAVQDEAAAAQQAQADIKQGMGLLGGNSSIADVVNEVMKLDGANEPLINAYQRLQGEMQAFKIDMDEATLAAGKTAQQVLEFADAEAKAAGGAQQLAKLLDSFNKDFFSAAELQAKAIDDQKTKVAGEANKIGEDPTESLAKFFADYQKALPTLTAEQIVQWKQFGVDLHDLYAAEQQADNAVKQAAANFSHFMAQFTQPTHFVDAFEQSMEAVDQEMEKNIAEATALAQANGQTGLSMQDLIAIHKHAAQEVAQLVMQLQASAQSLAFSLGLTVNGSLDQVNQEIAALESQSTSATDSMGGFSSAIHKTSQAATDAMNLMLGSLSPYNDQQKLQIALQGLRAGTATPDEVLQIGRSLYASSNAYNELFQEVMPYVGKQAHQGGGFTPGPTHSGGLSTTDSERLKELLAEQQQLQAANQLAQYQTLAQQIEEISKAKNEDVFEVMKDMKLNVQDFEKGLGIKSDADLKAFLDSLGTQVDSANQNTSSIVDAINSLPEEIAKAIGGGNLGKPGTPVGTPGLPWHPGGGTIPPTGTPSPQPTPAPAPVPGPGAGNGNGSGDTPPGDRRVHISSQSVAALSAGIGDRIFEQMSRSSRQGL